MELTEAVRRVFGRHLLLIVACVVAGVLVGVLIAASKPAAYTSSARVMLGPQGSSTSDEVESIADGAGAIVTSPGVVREALAEANVDRDPVVLATESVGLEPLGVSGIVELHVTDADPAAAAAIANALAGDLVARWSEANGAGTADVTGSLQERVDEINADVAILDARIAEQRIELSGEVDEATRAQVRAALDAAIAERDGLIQQVLALQADLGGSLADAANRFAPRVVDAALAPTSVDPRQAIPIVALGALLGFLIGVGAAALIETFRPTLVGDEAIADALGAPVLGNLAFNGQVAFERGDRLPLQVRMAAARANAKTVELVPVAWPAEAPSFWVVADDLDGGASRAATEDAVDGHLVVHPFDRDAPDPIEPDRRRSRAMVAVTPRVIERSRIREIIDLQQLTAWPLIGVITFTTKKGHPKQARRAATEDRARSSEGALVHAWSHEPDR